MSLTATAAELSRIPANGKREACLIVDFSDGTFAGCRIAVAEYHGGHLVNETKIREWLLGNAQERCDFECKTRGISSVPVKWEH